MEVLEAQPRLEAEKDSPKSPTARHSFFIQDILSPEFGNKQLKDQYYAYLHYYYSLHVQNVMLMQNQHHLQMLQKEKMELESTGLNFDGSYSNVVNGHSALFSQPTSERVIRPTPRSLKIPNVHNLNPKHSADFSNHHSTLKNSHHFSKNKNICASSSSSISNSANINNSISKSEPISPCSVSENSSISSPNYLHHSTSSPESPRISGFSGESARSPGSVSESGSNASAKDLSSSSSSKQEGDGGLWPAWVYCTRYSDRPSSGPRSRKIKRKNGTPQISPNTSMEKRPRIAFTNEQLASLKREFDENRYLTEERRAKLAAQLDLTESQVKIWFQNKRAKLKKSTGLRNPLALQLMQQGLYNHATVPTDTEENSDQE